VPLDRVASTPEPAPPERSAASTRAPIVVTGRLTDASGKEFRTLRGLVRVTDARGSRPDGADPRRHVFDRRCRSGPIDIGVEASGFRRVARAVTLEEHETERREDFALEPVWTIAVRFVTTDGAKGSTREPPIGTRFWAVAHRKRLRESAFRPELAEVPEKEAMRLAVRETPGTRGKRSGSSTSAESRRPTSVPY
jgi:hypothetical protein